MLLFNWFYTSHLFQGVRMGYLHANVRMVSHLSSFFSGSGGSFYMLMFDWFYTSYLF